MSTPIKTLENLLNYTALRNKVISKNIANIGTEGYKREDVEFKEILSNNMNSVLETTSEKHLQALQTSGNDDGFRVVLDDSQDMTSGVNNVDIDKEMGALAENTLLYKFASKRLGDYFKQIQNVIKGGGGQG